MSHIKTLLLVTLSMLATADVLAQRAWPEKVFDCQVITSSGSTGLVGLQTFSLEDAEEGVLGLNATTLLGNRESAVRVVQCCGAGSRAIVQRPEFSGLGGRTGPIGLPCAVQDWVAPLFNQGEFVGPGLACRSPIQQAAMLAILRLCRCR